MKEINLFASDDLSIIKQNELSNEFIDNLFKRLNYLHGEIIKRTYEGIFINKALETLRDTMTDVLLSKNTSSRLIPNIDRKSINHYCDAILGDCFIPNNVKELNKIDPVYNIIHSFISNIIKEKEEPENYENNHSEEGENDGGVVQNAENNSEALYYKETTREEIIFQLKDKFTYCVCLVLNKPFFLPIPFKAPL